MARTNGGVVILGAGHAGGAVALELRQLGHAGEITLVGEERHLPYERPSLSKELLVGTDQTPHFLAPADRWATLGVATVLGVRATGIERAERRLALADGRRLPYDRLVFATGGVPRRPAWPEHPAIRTLRTADDATDLKALAATTDQAVVIGGGVIGLEVASSLRSLGLGVAVVERGAGLMARNVPADMAARMQALHQDAGIVLHLERTVVAMDPAGPALRLTLDDGVELPASLVVVGIGIVPDTALAEAAGLACHNGVVVDANYVTSDPSILAVGDAAHPPGGRNESWAHAQMSARTAARAIIGLEPEPEAVPWFWTSQQGHTLQIAGRPLDADRTIERGPVSLYCAGDLLAGVAALDAPREFAAGRRLIGRPLDWQRAADPTVDLRRSAL